MDDIEEKQQYLREKILNKGYDANKFASFLAQKKDKYAEVDLGMWDFDYLKTVLYSIFQLLITSVRR